MAKNDDVIKELLKTIETQTAALGPAPRVAWRTNGVFKYSDTQYFNINVVSNPADLAEAMGFLTQKHDSYVGGCRALNIDPSGFTWRGYPIEDWKEDFKTRIAILEYNKKKKKLNETKTKLHGLVSEKARTEMELEAIAKALKED